MIYFVLVDFFSLSMYFGVAKVIAKIVQMSEMKKKYAVFFFISECSLSYEKIVQASGMTKQNTQFFRMLSIKVGHGGAAATKKTVS